MSDDWHDQINADEDALRAHYDGLKNRPSDLPPAWVEAAAEALWYHRGPRG